MQKDTVEVIINEDGKSCTTLNPLGEKPIATNKNPDVFIERANWEQAENNRKTYEIANAKEIANIIRFKPGTIHKARIINNKAVIL